MKISLKNIPYQVLNVFFCIVSFWVPLAGFVIWLLARKTNPKVAKYILIMALIGFALNYILSSL